MIQGKNIYFRAIEESDFEFIVKARNLEDVNKYFYEHEPLSIRMQKNWYENYLKLQEENNNVKIARQTCEWNLKTPCV
jgi:hypothetical protein